MRRRVAGSTCGAVGECGPSPTLGGRTELSRLKSGGLLSLNREDANMGEQTSLARRYGRRASGRPRHCRPADCRLDEDTDGRKCWRLQPLQRSSGLRSQRCRRCKTNTTTARLALLEDNLAGRPIRVRSHTERLVGSEPTTTTASVSFQRNSSRIAAHTKRGSLTSIATIC